MKVSLPWKIALLPVALFILPLFMLGGTLLGAVSWWEALMDFWEGKI